MINNKKETKVLPLMIEQIGLTPDVEFCNGRTKGEIFNKIQELIEKVNLLLKKENETNIQ